MLQWPCTEAVFGNLAIELAGRVILPSHQGKSLGTRMLKEYLSENSTRYIATYTRNPAVLKMVSYVASKVFPLDEDPVLRDIARRMDNSTLIDGVAYHVGRYGNEGLYGEGYDPAADDLAHRFSSLKDIGNSLVVAADVCRAKLLQ